MCIRDRCIPSSDDRELGTRTETGGKCRSDTKGDRKSWTVSLSHAVTSLAKEVGGDRSKVTRVESGMWIIRGVSSYDA